MTRWHPWLVPGFLVSVIVALGVTLIAYSIRQPPLQAFVPTRPDPAEVGTDLVGPVEYTVDATASDAWTYFDFSRGSVVTGPGPLEWDLAFQRFHVIANGGPGFSGRGGILDLGEVAFDSIRRVPVDGYVETTAARDSVNAAIARWYSYSWTSHILDPHPRVYAVRTADGRYAKLEVLGYYCPGARPGCMTFRYAYQGSGEPTLVPEAGGG